MTELKSATEVLVCLTEATLEVLDEGAPTDVVKGLVESAVRGDPDHIVENTAAQSKLNPNTVAAVAAVVIAVIEAANLAISILDREPEPKEIVVVIKHCLEKDSGRFEQNLMERGIENPRQVVEAIKSAASRVEEQSAERI